MNPRVDLAELDTVAVGRGLGQIADRPGDVADAFFECREEVELPPEGEAPGFRSRREEGMAGSPAPPRSHLAGVARLDRRRLVP